MYKVRSTKIQLGLDSRLKTKPCKLSEIKKAGRKPAFFVIPLGFEPRTHTLKVYCSTS